MHEIFPPQKRAGDLTVMRESLAECVRVGNHLSHSNSSVLLSVAMKRRHNNLVEIRILSVALSTELVISVMFQPRPHCGEVFI